MNFLGLFHRRPIDDMSGDDRERLDQLERELARQRGEYRNLLQTVESGARQIHKRLDRLETVASILQLRGDLENDANT